MPLFKKKKYCKKSHSHLAIMKNSSIFALAKRKIRHQIKDT